MVLQDDGRTTWVAERLLKEKPDIDVIAEFAPVPRCDAPAVGRRPRRHRRPRHRARRGPGIPHLRAARLLAGRRGAVRHRGTDPGDVRRPRRGWTRCSAILRDRKLAFLRSTAGAPFDLLELGGGDASSTVISPTIFDRFVAPFDAPLVAAAHDAGQRIVYHTCGGMMPLLERIAGMQPDAMETFTPKDMGGDTQAGRGEGAHRLGGSA